MENRTPAAMRALLRKQQEIVQQEIFILTRTGRLLENKLRLLETAENVEPQTLRLEDHPSKPLILSAAVKTADEAVITQIIMQHWNNCAKQKLDAGQPLGAMVAPADILAGNTGVYAYFFSAADVCAEAPAQRCFMKPAGKYAVAYLQGDYMQTETTYRRLLAFIRTHHLTIAGYAYEEGILDEFAVKDPAAYLTRIAIHVAPQTESSLVKSDPDKRK